ncbi:MAG: phosphomannomutase/phosphoglucomutase [Oligoflexia bacterium]|nr:phosphomannomutase/phosphoglucomutase [Oligoflexia bacterium]
MNQEIFREYDIRGVVNKDFDLIFAQNLGLSFGSYLKQKLKKQSLTISIGYDARLSSPEIAARVAKGAALTGVNVLMLGLVTSPISYFSTFTLPIDGNIMITGSHNPPEYNGFKLSFGKSPLFGEEIQVLKKIILDKAFLLSEKQGTIKDHDIFPAYLDKFSKDIKLKNKVSAVIDCGNGAAGVVVKKLYELIGINCEILFEKPDGTFPNHHPDPTVEENLIALRKRVLETKADVGIGFDGDADRIGVIDHTGRALFGDELMVIFARSVLEKNPGAAIIGDVKCSDRLYDDIKKHGGNPIMYKTGHSLIKNKMKEVNSPFSGEMSGHVFFADRNYGYDDAVYAGARFIEIMSLTGKKVPELLTGLPPAFSTPEIRIDTTEDKKRKIVEEIKKLFPANKYKVNEIDGLRISFEDGFALVRSSNTQPVIVCRFEAQTSQRLNEIRSLVEGAVKKLL